LKKQRHKKVLQKYKIINDDGTHLVVGPVVYFMCLSFSNFHTIFILSNGDDRYPRLFVTRDFKM